MHGTIGDIGERLRRARQSAGLDLRRIAGATGVSALDLQAVEAGQTKLLPAFPQALCLIGTYADYLGIDLDEELSHLRDEIGSSACADAGARVREPARETSLPWAGALFAAGLFVSTAFALGFVFQDRFSIAIEDATAAPAAAPAPVARQVDTGIVSASVAAVEETVPEAIPAYTLLSAPVSPPPDEMDGAIDSTVEMETANEKPGGNIPVARPVEPPPVAPVSGIRSSGSRSNVLPQPRPAHTTGSSRHAADAPPPGELITASLREPGPDEAQIGNASAGDQQPDLRHATGSVFMRRAPDKSSRAVTSLARCETVELVGTDKAGYWMEVRRANGASGWVYRGFLSEHPSAACR